MPISVVMSLLSLHFVSDFVFQSNWMALNKSKNSWLGLKALTTHAGVYSALFFLFGWQFGLITFITHLITDFITSRVTSGLWFIDMVPASGKWGGLSIDTDAFHVTFDSTKRHWFFVAIGLDQLIHYGTLLLTWRYIYG